MISMQSGTGTRKVNAGPGSVAWSIRPALAISDASEEANCHCGGGVAHYVPLLCCKLVCVSQ